jgi:hypothetical protein
MNEKVIQAQTEGIRALERRIGIGEELLECRLLVVRDRLGQTGLGTLPPQTKARAVRNVRVTLSFNGVFPVSAHV